MLELKIGHMGLQELTLDNQDLNSRLKAREEITLVDSWKGENELAVKVSYIVSAEFTDQEMELFGKVGMVGEGVTGPTFKLGYRHTDGKHILRCGTEFKIYAKYNGCRGEKSKRAKEEKLLAQVKNYENRNWTSNCSLDHIGTFVQAFAGFVEQFNTKHVNKYREQWESDRWDWDAFEESGGGIFPKEKQDQLDVLRAKRSTLIEQLKEIYAQECVLLDERQIARQQELAKDVEQGAKDSYVPQELKEELVEKLQNGKLWPARQKSRRLGRPYWA